MYINFLLKIYTNYGSNEGHYTYVQVKVRDSYCPTTITKTKVHSTHSKPILAYNYNLESTSNKTESTVYAYSSYQ